MEQCKELRNDAFYLIGDIYLIAVELYFVWLQFDVRLYSWEVENAGEVERIVNVEVYPEQWLVLHGVEVLVKFLIIFIFQRRRRLCPKRFGVVDEIVFFGFHLFSIFPFGLFAKGDRYGKELTVLVQQVFDA